MEPTLPHRPADPRLPALDPPGGRRHRRVSPPGRGRSSSPRSVAIRTGRQPAQACDTPTKTASSQTFIKRVVGLPGDRLKIVGGHVFRNGVREKDSYIAPCDGAEGGQGCNFRKTIVVPAGDYYMMGGQPWRVRRQPLLGSRPAEVDHRRGVLHLLASRPNRDPLTRTAWSGRSRPPSRWTGNRGPTGNRAWTGNRVARRRGGRTAKGQASAAGQAPRRTPRSQAAEL